MAEVVGVNGWECFDGQFFVERRALMKELDVSEGGCWEVRGQEVDGAGDSWQVAGDDGLRQPDQEGDVHQDIDGRPLGFNEAHEYV